PLHELLYALKNRLHLLICCGIIVIRNHVCHSAKCSFYHLKSFLRFRCCREPASMYHPTIETTGDSKWRSRAISLKSDPRPFRVLFVTDDDAVLRGRQTQRLALLIRIPRCRFC